jgi:hypothetical protein
MQMWYIFGDADAARCNGIDIACKHGSWRMLERATEGSVRDIMVDLYEHLHGHHEPRLQ